MSQINQISKKLRDRIDTDMIALGMNFGIGFWLAEIACDIIDAAVTNLIFGW